MDASNLVSIVSKKIIKPFSPTPTSLHYHKLSVIDQGVANVYVPFAFFYNPRECTNNINDISKILEDSLSKVLTLYYPFAGKLTDNASVECNDSGVEFITTKINCPMSQILNGEREDSVFPKGVVWCKPLNEDSIVVVQLNQFNCDGIAISVSLIHRVGDAYTLGNFVNDWADIARETTTSRTIQSNPNFNAAVFFPPINELQKFESVKLKESYPSRTFTFSSSKLDALRSKVKDKLPQSMQNPTTSEILSAFMFQRAVIATKKGTFRQSAAIYPANLRPPVPKNTMGNLLTMFPLVIKEEEEIIDLSRVVVKLRTAKEELRQSYKYAEPNELLPILHERYKEVNDVLTNDCYDTYEFSSLTSLPLYDLDFGWGKPKRVGMPSYSDIKNLFMLLSDKTRDSVEVTSYMKEEELLELQRDEEMLEFAQF